MRSSSAACVLCLMCLLAGCLGIEEYETLWDYRAEVLSLPGLHSMGSISGIEEGSALLALKGTALLVSSREGTVYRAGTESMEILNEWTVGDPTVGDYGQMLRRPWVPRFYLVSGRSGLTEASTTEGTVLEQFEVGDSPLAICHSLDSAYMFVSDGSTGEIFEIFCAENAVRRSLECEHAPVAMAPFFADPGYILMACADSRGTLYFLNMDYFYPIPWESGSPCSDVVVISDTLYALAQPDWAGGSGRLLVCSGAEIGIEQTRVSIEGHPFRLCADPDGSLLYCGSRRGNGTTLISVYSVDSSRVISERVLDGFLQDMAISRDRQRLMVLLFE